MTTALDLFAGPGGWSVACAHLGVDEIGVEIEPSACETARAAGHVRVQADVRRYVPDDRPDGLIASPPCQTFSQAGRGNGQRALDRLVAAVPDVARGVRPADALGVDDVTMLPDDDALFGLVEGVDPRGVLVLEPMRYVLDLEPAWIVMEQVPQVAPIWGAYAAALATLGYNVAHGIMRAERWGVPQTRRRAVLVASREHVVDIPAATHSRYYADEPTRLDDGVLPWVSMADALGWSRDDVVGFARRADRGAKLDVDGVEYRARDLRSGDQPAFAVTQKSRSWIRHPDAMRGSGNVGGSADRLVEHPAPTIVAKGTAVWRINDQSGAGRDELWPYARPATTIAGRDIVADPGTNANRHNGSTKSRNDGVRVTPAEAGVLQSFPRDYPWRGTRTQQHQQIGDAMPPLLAAAVIGSAL